MDIKKPYTRKLSSSERLYLAGKDVFPSFCIQIMLESKDTIDVSLLRNAVHIASQEHPSSRLILKGKRKASFWVDGGVHPPVLEIKNPRGNEINFNFEKIDVFSEKIDVVNGPTSRVYVLRNKVDRVVFQVFHGTMDAQGAMMWVKDIFRVLQGKQPLGAKSTISDQEYLSTICNKKYRKNYKFDCPSFLEIETSKQKGFIWSRMVIDGQINGIVSKLAKAISDQLPDQHKRFMIPVDIRRHAPNDRIGGNFSNPLFFEVSDHDSWEGIYEKMVKSLAYSEELIYGRSDYLLHAFPLWFLEKGLQLLFKKEMKTRKFMFTSVISTIGKVKYKWFSYDGYQPDTISFLPVNIPMAGTSFVITENENKTVVMATAPAAITTKKALEDTLERLKQKISNDKEPSMDTITAPIRGDQLPIPDGTDVFSLIIQQSINTPDSIAIVDGKQKFTYKALVQRSQEIATEIVKIMEPKDAVIGVSMNRSVDYVASLIAIMKIGGTFMPIDREYPKQRIAYMLNDSNAALILCDGFYEMQNSIPMLDVQTIGYSSDTELIEDKQPRSKVAYIIYTSGSTGNPKGVQISHANFINYLYWAKKEYANTSKISFPLFTSISFDLTITSVFLPLISGGMIKVYSEPFQNNVLSAIFGDQDLNAIKLTPTHFRVLAISGITTSTITNIIVGGEELTSLLSETITNQFTNTVRIFNEYGPTEATVGCIVHTFNQEKDNRSSVPIGLPITNTTIYLLDDHLEMVPKGVVGEIHIAGDSVATGYVNNPEMTSQKFIKHPLTNQILYRTGDLAEQLADGNIIYKGRIDDQVKIRGHRIELAEIEQCLSEHPKIKQALAIVIHAEHSKMIALYYVGDAVVKEVEIKSYLMSRLPKYMIPNYIMELQQIPLNTNGKVDKTKLPKPIDFIDSHIAALETFTPLELEIRALFSEIVEIEEKYIDKDTNFYDIGGDSLGITMLISKMMNKLLPIENHEEWLGSVHELITSPTLEAFVSKVEAILKDKKSQ